MLHPFCQWERLGGWLVRSTNGGASWLLRSTPSALVNGSSVGKQYFQSIAISNTSKVSIAFCHTADNVNVHTYLVESTDGGATFAVSKQISEYLSNTTIGANQYHYMGTAATADYTYVTWTQHTSEGNEDIYWATTDPAPRQPHDFIIYLTSSSGYTYPRVRWARNEEPQVNSYDLYRRVKQAGLWDSWRYHAYVSQTTPPIDTVGYTDWSMPTAGSGTDSVQYKVQARKSSGELSVFSEVVSMNWNNAFWKLSSGERDQQLAFALSQNTPNPFNPRTRISFSIPSDGLTMLVVYDVLGRNVETLVSEFRNAGHFTVDFAGEALPSGVYIYRLNHNGFTLIRRMVLTK
jgi:hypothetical protein